MMTDILVLYGREGAQHAMETTIWSKGGGGDGGGRWIVGKGGESV
jgi:hypothetical protein